MAVLGVQGFGEFELWGTLGSDPAARISVGPRMLAPTASVLPAWSGAQ